MKKLEDYKMDFSENMTYAAMKEMFKSNKIEKKLGIWLNYYSAPDALRILKKQFGKPTWGASPSADAEWEYIFTDQDFPDCVFRIWEKEKYILCGFGAPAKTWDKAKCNKWNDKMTAFIVELFGQEIIYRKS